MKLLIEIEGPAADKPVAGEPDVVTQIWSFVRRLVEQRCRVVKASVNVHRLEHDDVLVKRDQLLRLQGKAAVYEWLSNDPDAILALMNNAKPPADVAYKLGEITGEHLKRKLKLPHLPADSKANGPR
jgi:hypothetical protein